MGPSPNGSSSAAGMEGLGVGAAGPVSGEVVVVMSPRE
jgi:hypothetical protein